MKYTTKITSVTVVPEGETIYSEMATQITITDESCGEFLWVEQSGRTEAGKIAIDPDEWPSIRDAIDSMIAQCEGVK